MPEQWIDDESEWKVDHSTIERSMQELMRQMKFDPFHDVARRAAATILAATNEHQPSGSEEHQPTGAKGPTPREHKETQCESDEEREKRPLGTKESPARRREKEKARRMRQIP